VIIKTSVKNGRGDMSTVIRTSVLLAFILLLAGCQPVDSLNPLYTQKDVVFDSALLGKWTEEGGTLEFFEGPDHSYNVIFRDDSNPPEQMVLRGHLVNLQGHRFLDLAQKEWVGPPELYALQIVQTKNGPQVSPPFLHSGDGAYLEFAGGSNGLVTLQTRIAHWFFKVTSDDKNLRLDFIDDERLEKLLEPKKIQIGHVMAPARNKDSHHLLLTASTADLQRFMVEYVNDEQVFSDSIKLKRPE
jgi:hypothetical protein